jgi:hypothetical protein
MSRTLGVAIGILALAIMTGCLTHKAAKGEQAKAESAITPTKAQAMTEDQKKKVPPQYVETPTGRWLVHDMNRPAPPVITPGSECAQAPSDAVVLFDGTPESMANWIDTKGQPSKWIIRDGYLESVKGAGHIRSKQEFGSCQLHVEFATPSPAKGTSQDRGNSGVFLQGRYEVQVLDSYENKTYPDGQCGALYGRAVPLVNACRPPGQWQSYDIIYHRPLFNADGKVRRKATFTILQNGVLIQDHVELEGSTDWINDHAVTAYEPHGDKGPLQLQDHGNPVRYRNIWLRELND